MTASRQRLLGAAAGGIAAVGEITAVGGITAAGGIAAGDAMRLPTAGPTSGPPPR